MHRNESKSHYLFPFIVIFSVVSVLFVYWLQNAIPSSLWFFNHSTPDREGFLVGLTQFPAIVVLGYGIARYGRRQSYIKMTALILMLLFVILYGWSGVDTVIHPAIGG